jgi:hypothetical protein
MKLYRNLESASDGRLSIHEEAIEERFGVMLNARSSWGTMVEDMKAYSLDFPDVVFVIDEEDPDGDTSSFTFSNGELVSVEEYGKEYDEEDEEYDEEDEE